MTAWLALLRATRALAWRRLRAGDRAAAVRLGRLQTLIAERIGRGA